MLQRIRYGIFLEIWVRAFRGDALAYRRFATNRIILALVEEFLQRQPKKRKSRTRDDSVEKLTMEIYQQLLVNDWAPAPASSSEEILQQLLTFLARRIDWTIILDIENVGGDFQDDRYAADEEQEEDEEQDGDEQGS